MCPKMILTPGKEGRTHKKLLTVCFREGEPKAGVGESRMSHWTPFEPFEWHVFKKTIII